jgi:hypothetical protein
MQELEARGWEGNREVPDSDEESLVDTVRRAGPLGVECPACGAGLGLPCRNGKGTGKSALGKPLRKPHSARIREASGEQQLTVEQRAAEEQRIREASAQALARFAAEENIPDAEIVEEAS